MVNVAPQPGAAATAAPITNVFQRADSIRSDATIDLSSEPPVPLMETQGARPQLHTDPGVVLATPPCGQTPRSWREKTDNSLIGRCYRFTVKKECLRDNKQPVNTPRCLWTRRVDLFG